jgi:hypothetical protein
MKRIPISAASLLPALLAASDGIDEVERCVTANVLPLPMDRLRICQGHSGRAHK